jgi:CubicO group peptidase (beta-lactamase class C family)
MMSVQNRGYRLFVSAWLAVLTGGLAAALASPAGGVPPADRPAWAGQVDKLFAAFDRPDSPGCALGVFKDGRVLYERGYGSADLEHDVPITPNTVFYAGSVSKQFTAMAAALAIRQGLFALDDDVRKLVPELPAYEAPIRVRHLVHHTSGLRDINTLVDVAGQRDEMAFDNDAVLRVLARQRALNFTPGAEYLYSNSGYAVLALMIERASKTSFTAYADAQIFKPLGMTVTHFHTDLGRLVRDRAYAYDRPAAGDLRLDTPQNERAGAGGLFTSVRELLLWDENFYTGRVGGSDIIAELETTDRLNDGALNRYAWGLQAATYRGIPVIEHSGALGGYRAQTFRVREQHFSVAILCNVSSANPTELSHRVADICLEGRFKPAAPAAASVQPAIVAERPAPPAYTPDDLAAFAGVYTSEELETRYRIAVDNGGLTVQRGVERDATALRATGPDEFRARSATLRFVRGEGRIVTGLVLDAGRVRGIAFTRKQPEARSPATLPAASAGNSR